MLRHIPLAAVMGIHVADYQPDRLALAAPLTPNLNHEGIAFGGAIECLGTLACWGFLWLRLAAADEAMIVIQRGETEFIAPITGELRAEAGFRTWKSGNASRTSSPGMVAPASN